jgi:hypothetical protein
LWRWRFEALHSQLVPADLLGYVVLLGLWVMMVVVLLVLV